VTALYELVPVGQHVDLPSVNPLKYQQAGSVRRHGVGDESMTVSIRYKQPEASTSVLMSVPVSTKTAMTPALGFAASVAAFGMLLRESEFKGTATFASARALAETQRGDDRYGHRAEFARLIGIAESLALPHIRSVGGAGR
jgi:Ca-activated chloride channel family protein